MANIEQSTQMVQKAIKEIEGKMNDPSFLEILANNGHMIASDLLENVRVNLNYIGLQSGKDNPIYIELCEAIAIIGSGCLRWATARTRTLFMASDFRRNSSIYYSEKTKVDKCHELINVFQNMVRPDSPAFPIIIDVRNIIDDLYFRFQKKSGCYIATVVYKNPYSPEVLAFKSFRDNVLYRNPFGRAIMFVYYLLSPGISRLLFNKEKTNNLIKYYLLDPLYRKVSKYEQCSISVTNKQH